MGRKAYIIHPAEKEALAILYSRFIETGMIHEELANKLTTLGKTSAFNSLKGNRGTTITEFEELCIVLGMSAVKVLKQAESAKHHHLLKLPPPRLFRLCLLGLGSARWRKSRGL